MCDGIGKNDCNQNFSSEGSKPRTHMHHRSVSTTYIGGGAGQQLRSWLAVSLLQPAGDAPAAADLLRCLPCSPSKSPACTAPQALPCSSWTSKSSRGDRRCPSAREEQHAPLRSGQRMPPQIPWDYDLEAPASCYHTSPCYTFAGFEGSTPPHHRQIRGEEDRRTWGGLDVVLTSACRGKTVDQQ